jgi:hypothetical protein
MEIEWKLEGRQMVYEEQYMQKHVAKKRETKMVCSGSGNKTSPPKERDFLEVSLG